MQKLKCAIVFTTLILVTAPFAHATGGCVDSPENPTVIFGLITAVASFGLAHLRNRKGSRDK
jgi:hypothetical protein